MEEIAYGKGPRHRLDLFWPASPAGGLVVFVHGGYWRAFDKSMWSHLAGGALARGLAVAVPGYDLCPAVRIADITRQVGAAVAAAGARVAGPVRLAGHSAGGHLVARLTCRDGPLDADLRRRLVRTVSISGLHDLAPLLNTRMNEDLRLDVEEAATESPVNCQPLDDADVVCWVGAAERPEFIRQNGLLAAHWTAPGVRIKVVREPGRHHFDVIDSLADPDGALTEALLADP